MLFNEDQNDLHEVQNNTIKEVNSSDIEIITIVAGMLIIRMVHYAKTDLNKKSGAMHPTLISFNVDAQGFRKTKNENPPTW